MNPATIPNLKQGLRISHNKLDSSLEMAVDSCLADLRSVGVKHATDHDPLVYNAIELWCRSFFTDDPVKSAEWWRRYEALKASLMMAEGYGHQEGTGDE